MFAKLVFGCLSSTVKIWYVCSSISQTILFKGRFLSSAKRVTFTLHRLLMMFLTVKVLKEELVITFYDSVVDEGSLQTLSSENASFFSISLYEVSVLAVRQREGGSQVEPLQEVFFPTVAKIIHLFCSDLVMGSISPVEFPSKVSMSLQKWLFMKQLSSIYLKSQIKKCILFIHKRPSVCVRI